MAERDLRRSFGMRLRRVLEKVILLTGIVLGLGIVGGCSTSGFEARFDAEGFLAGGFFALILVGAVFLFTSMSRDVRLLRERFTDDAAATNEHPVVETPAPSETDVPV